MSEKMIITKCLDCGYTTPTIIDRKTCHKCGGRLETIAEEEKE